MRKGLSQSKLKKLLKAAEETYGNVQAMAKTCGVSDTTIYNYRNKCKELDDAIIKAQDQFYDTALGMLQMHIMSGDDRLLPLYLKCSPAAKRKGWGEKVEMHSADNMTDQQKQDYAKSLLGMKKEEGDVESE